MTTLRAYTPPVYLQIARETEPVITTPKSRPKPVVGRVIEADRGHAQYLRRWIAHQAELYNNLLATIASAPRPRGW